MTMAFIFISSACKLTPKCKLVNVANLVCTEVYQDWRKHGGSLSPQIPPPPPRRLPSRPRAAIAAQWAAARQYSKFTPPPEELKKFEASLAQELVSKMVNLGGGCIQVASIRPRTRSAGVSSHFPRPVLRRGAKNPKIQCDSMVFLTPF